MGRTQRSWIYRLQSPPAKPVTWLSKEFLSAENSHKSTSSCFENVDLLKCHNLHATVAQHICTLQREKEGNNYQSPA